MAALEAERAAAAAPTLTLAHGDTYGATSPTSKLLRELPGVLAMNQLGIDVDTFGNNNFNPGLAAFTDLLPSTRATYTVANLLTPLPRVARYVVRTLPNGARVALVGILSAGDASVLDPYILSRLQFQLDGGADVAALLAARTEAMATLPRPDYAVALLSLRANTPADVDPYVAPLGGLFDLVCAGIQQTTPFVRTVNGTLTVGGSDFGVQYVRVQLPARTAALVPLPASVDPPSALHASLWRSAATCIGSAPGASVTARFVARSRAAASSRVREVRQTENALMALMLRSMARLGNTTLAVLNTGALRDDLPSSFAPSAQPARRRPTTVAAPPYDTVSGDCVTISPFGNVFSVADVSSADLYNIARWCVESDPAPDGAPNLMGALIGLKIEGEIWSHNLTARLRSVRWPDGRPVDRLLTTDSHRIALISFLAGGGDGFPLLSRGATQINDLLDSDILCLALNDTTRTQALHFSALLPGDVVLIRRERTCASASYVMDMQAHALYANRTALEQLAVQLGANASSPDYCVELALRPARADEFLSTRTVLSTISTALAPPSPYAVVARLTNPIVITGQLVGDPSNCSVSLPASRAASAMLPPREGVRIRLWMCLPVDETISVYSRFSESVFALSINGSRFLVNELDAPPTLIRDPGTGLLRMCGNVTLPLGTTAVVAPSRVAPAAYNYSAVEQAFLFLFGMLWFAFTCYVAVLLVHHVWVIHMAQAGWGELLKPASFVRVELVLVGVCRFLYFVLLPWNILQLDPLGTIFLFEFPFILDFSIYSVFVQLFVSVFHWRAMRAAQNSVALWVPLLVVNALLFTFFFVMLIVYGSVTDPSVSSGIVLAYRITLAVVALLVVVAFAVYGTVLLLRVHATLKGQGPPPWWAIHRLTREAQSTANRRGPSGWTRCSGCWP